MELFQLRAFLAVAQTRNLTRAAEGLHLSQSALSVQISGDNGLSKRRAEALEHGGL